MVLSMDEVVRLKADILGSKLLEKEFDADNIEGSGEISVASDTMWRLFTMDAMHARSSYDRSANARSSSTLNTRLNGLC